MIKPDIEEAKRIAKKYGMDGVVIFFIKGDQLGFASYGKDRQHCRRYGAFADEVFDKVMMEEIKI